MTSALYLALLALAAPLAFAAGWRARGHRSWRIEVPRDLVRGRR
jgi:hypothetical protein